MCVHSIIRHLYNYYRYRAFDKMLNFLGVLEESRVVVLTRQIEATERMLQWYKRFQFSKMGNLPKPWLHDDKPF